jgi:hypothetical protein
VGELTRQRGYTLPIGWFTVDLQGRARPADQGAGCAPDLVVHWGDRPGARIARVQSSVHGEVVRSGVGSGRSGNHVDDAWAIVATGASRLRDIGRAPRITDIGAQPAPCRR